jgi:hypothetical protein
MAPRTVTTVIARKRQVDWLRRASRPISYLDAIRPLLAEE